MGMMQQIVSSSLYDFKRDPNTESFGSKK